MICDICQSIFTVDPIQNCVGPDSPHHRTCQSFKRSVQLGCYICSKVWKALKSGDQDAISSAAGSGQHSINNEAGARADGSPEESVENLVTTLSLRHGFFYGWPESYQLEVTAHARAVSNPKIKFGAYTPSFVFHHHDDSKPLFFTNRLPRNTKSAETLSLARKWIASCTEEHGRCNTGAGETGWYPTRLLDCGASEGPETCRLVETKRTTIQGPYMTLSHCWGLANCLELTTGNHAQFLDRIPFSLLPQLYLDAVYATRKLGVRYLWIDSLCIIQKGDESKDWQHEVTVMGKTYSKSFCNISATDAPDSNHTMFRTRDPDLLYPQIVNVSINGDIAPFVVRDRFWWENEVSHALINTRAWVVQERLLSPRVLHFGRHQMHWECQEKDACEIYPGGLPFATSSAQGRLKDWTPRPDAAAGQAGDMVAAHQYWERIIRAYSVGNLTYTVDKLVALSGVAKMMADVLRDDYVAGMWRRYLERDLLWSAVGRPRERAGQPAIYRAPSWSWASVDGLINPGMVDVDATDMLIEVQDVRLDYSTNDTTGLVKGGWLRLRGVLKQLALQYHHSPLSRKYQHWGMSVNGVAVSVPGDSKMQSPQQPHIWPDFSHEDFHKQITDGEVYGMPAKKREGDGESVEVLVLLLEDRERGVFRRIGIAYGHGKEVKEKILARSAEEDQFPCEEYKDGLHSIRII